MGEGGEGSLTGSVHVVLVGDLKVGRGRGREDEGWPTNVPLS